MNQKLYELFQSYLKANKDDVAKVARQCYCNIIERADAIYHDREYAVKLALAIFASFIRVDNTLTKEECAFFQYIYQDSSITTNRILKLIENCSDNEFYNAIKEACKTDNILKQNILKFGLCACSIDGQIHEEESDFVAWLLN